MYDVMRHRLVRITEWYLLEIILAIMRILGFFLLLFFLGRDGVYRILGGLSAFFIGIAAVVVTGIILKKTKAFAGGVLSGIVEPAGAVLTILAAGLIVPALPYLLSFAAGAMLYVVVEELIPEMSAGEHSNIGTIFFAVGFSLMMILDVALG